MVTTSTVIVETVITSRPATQPIDSSNPDDTPSKDSL